MHPTTTPSLLPRERRPADGTGADTTLLVNLSFGGLALVRQGLGVFVTEPVIMLSGLADGLVARPLEPQVSLTMTAVYSRRRPVPRVVARFMANLRKAILSTESHLRALGIETSAL